MGRECKGICKCPLKTPIAEEVDRMTYLLDASQLLFLTTYFLLNAPIFKMVLVTEKEVYLKLSVNFASLRLITLYHCCVIQLLSVEFNTKLQ